MADIKPSSTRGCTCPYCEEDMKALLAPICQACGAVVVYCQACNAPLAKDSNVCSKCGKINE
jgi:hypothetical protein